jgi:hypothetical protein
MMTDAALQAWQPDEPAQARALVSAVQNLALSRGVSLPPAPLEPDNCCSNDCLECVWLQHYQELAYWRDEALLRWS